MGMLAKLLICHWRQLILVAIPIVLLPLPIICASYVEARCGYVILIMISYWMTEAIPLPVTALIPLFAFPALGVMGTKEVASNYMIDPIMMFLGGMMFGAAVEFCHLDRRIGLFVLKHTGKNLRLLIAGFMGSTMFLSMWISNTAAIAIMVPTLQAILVEISEKKKRPIHLAMSKIPITDREKEKRRIDITQVIVDGNKCVSTDTLCESIDVEQPIGDEVSSTEIDIDTLEKNFSTCLYLAVAYAANIGGTGSITGTPPNLILMGILNKSFKEKTELNFSSWMAFNIPGVLISTIIGYFWLQYIFLGVRCNSKKTKQQEEKETSVQKVIRAKYNALGPVSFHEWTVIVLFFLLLMLWVFRSPGTIPGWSIYFESLYGNTIAVSDTSSVMFIIFLLFAIPSNLPSVLKSTSYMPMPCKGSLEWSFLQKKIPWAFVLLMGSSFTLSEAASKSGLSVWVGLQLKGLSVIPAPLLVFSVIGVTVILTNIGSTNGTAAILLPILKELSLVLCVNPLYLMLPTTVACSYAFMLPISTPPNAIVYYTGAVRIVDMMKAGFMMNIICIIVMNIMINTLGDYILQLDDLPSWVNSTTSGDILQC